MLCFWLIGIASDVCYLFRFSGLFMQRVFWDVVSEGLGFSIPSTLSRGELCNLEFSISLISTSGSV
jgi:hypothetical protein